MFEKQLLKSIIFKKTYLPIVRSNRQISSRESQKYLKSYVCGPSKVPLIGNTIGEIIDIGAEKWGNEREAVVSVHQDIRKGFLDVKEEADKLATGLLFLGIIPGDRVGIWSPNTYEWYLTQMAAAKLGAILVNINPAYQPGELKYCLNKVGVKAIIASQTFKTQDYYNMLMEVIPEIGNTKSGNLHISLVNFVCLNFRPD